MKTCARCGSCFDDDAAMCTDGGALTAEFDGSRVVDGKYRLDKRLGAGGMGVVYQAFHLAVDRVVALKLMIEPTTDPEWLRRFQIEGKALGRLEHPNIVNVTDAGVDARGFPYLVMQYLEGRDLRAAILRGGPMPVAQVVAMLRPVADAVDFAHSRGVLHRDLKAANVFLARSGRGDEIKVLDFGVATLLRPAGSEASTIPVINPDATTVPRVDVATHSPGATLEIPITVAPGIDPRDQWFASTDTAILGTLTHMAPELFESHPPSRASDIYAFGVLAYELLAATTPFTGSQNDLIAHVNVPPPPPSGVVSTVPPEIDTAIDRALAKDPQRRPASAGEFVRDLASAAHAAEVREWRSLELPRRRWFAAFVAAAAIIVSYSTAMLPAIEAFEQRTVDFRFAAVPDRSSETRVAAVLLDEESLARSNVPLIARDADFAEVVRQLLEHGAQHVGIDFLLPPQWASSQPLADLFIRYHDRLTLSVYSAPQGQVLGGTSIPPVAAAVLGPAAREMLAYVNLASDRDGVLRRTHSAYTDANGDLQPAFAWRVASAVDPKIAAAGSRLMWIDQALSPATVPVISWSDLTATLQRQPNMVAGRSVIVGSSFVGSGDERHRIAARFRVLTVPGALVQALLAQSAIEHFEVRTPLKVVTTSLLGLIAVALAYVILTFSTTAKGLALGAIAAAAWLLSAIVLFRFASVALPLVWPIMAIGATMLLASAARARLAPYPTEVPLK